MPDAGTPLKQSFSGVVARYRGAPLKPGFGLSASVAWHLTPERLVFVDIADDKTERVGEQHDTITIVA